MILKNLIEKGGATMLPLIILGFISVAIIADRVAVILIIIFSRKENKPNMAKNANVLDLIAQIAPVIGFLGTVMGIMHSFQMMSQTEKINMAIVAGGMYEALYTTAAGLVISIVDGTTAQILRWKKKNNENIDKV